MTDSEYPRQRIKPDTVTTVLELVGAACIVAGIGFWSIPAALIVAGAGLLLAAHPIRLWRVK